MLLKFDGLETQTDIMNVRITKVIDQVKIVDLKLFSCAELSQEDIRQKKVALCGPDWEESLSDGTGGVGGTQPS